jgi:hypothetical protein
MHSRSKTCLHCETIASSAYSGKRNMRVSQDARSSAARGVRDEKQAIKLTVSLQIRQTFPSLTACPRVEVLLRSTKSGWHAI